MKELRPNREGVIAAASRVKGEVTRTPLLPLEIAGVGLWAKAECLQQGGSFKLRGATNRLMQLDEEQRRRGVVAFSSGNHGQGVAIAAKKLGISATVVMPSDAPAVKHQAILAAGAQIVTHDRKTESREEIGARLAAERSCVLVPSFDDVDIIEGQGTAGLEIAEQMGGSPDKVLICCGGGGLSAGIALALPKAEIVTVEPVGWDDMARSFKEGRIIPVSEDAPFTRCDSLQTKIVSPITYRVLREAGARGVSVTEEETAAAIAFAARRLRLVVEPGGAVALAAALSGKAGTLTERSVILISGGNIDPLLYAEILREQASRGQA